MKDGSQVIAKFHESKKNLLITLDKGEFSFQDLRSVNYYKPLPFEIEPRDH